TEQTYPNIELLVMDDASTDDSVAQIEAFLSGCPLPHRFFPLPENQGNCAAFNYAFRHSQGEFIVDLATDDLLHPERIARQVSAFQNLDQRYGVVFSDVEYIDAEGAFLKTHYQRDAKGNLLESVPSGDLFTRLLRPGGFISVTSQMTRRSVLEDLGGFDENLAYEDYDFWLRSSRKYHYFFQDKVLTKKRVLKDSLGQQFYRPRTEKMLRSTLVVCRKAQALIQNNEEKAALLASVRYHLRQAVLTENFSVAQGFGKLRKELTDSSFQDHFWDTLAKQKIPLNWAYRVWAKLF
ncbi:MAG: glycosyltransferase, partial [Bacteroidota bacterium]